MIEIKVKLSNGFTFLIDFVDSEVSTIVETWKDYYTSIGVQEFEIFSQKCKHVENLNRYNYWAFQLFGDQFSNLSCKEKLSVAEMVDEIVA